MWVCRGIGPASVFQHAKSVAKGGAVLSSSSAHVSPAPFTYISLSPSPSP